MGARVPFVQKQVTLAHPVKSGELFFSGDTSTRAVKLLPLSSFCRSRRVWRARASSTIALKKRPERFVSYAYGPEATVLEHYPDVR